MHAHTIPEYCRGECDPFRHSFPYQPVQFIEKGSIVIWPSNYVNVRLNHVNPVKHPRSK